MNKCKDCTHFLNDCGFSKVDKQLKLTDGNFVACGQFVAKEEVKEEQRNNYDE